MSEAGPGLHFQPLARSSSASGGLCGWPLWGQGGPPSRAWREGGGRPPPRRTRTHLDVRSCFCSSSPSEAEARDSPSRFCSRTVDTDCFLRSFLWVAVSLRACAVEAGCAAAPGPCLARWAGAMLPSEAAPGPSERTPGAWVCGGQGPKPCSKSNADECPGRPRAQCRVPVGLSPS